MYLDVSTCSSLALTWLQQQDLSDKSAVEVADLYCSAVSQISAKYVKRQKTIERRVIHHDFDADEQ